MTAFDVIGMNFQLRLGVHHRIFGQQQILVRLARIGLLRVFVNDNLAVEYSMALPRSRIPL